jgi:hypothetical protein
MNRSVQRLLASVAALGAVSAVAACSGNVNQSSSAERAGVASAPAGALGSAGQPAGSAQRAGANRTAVQARAVIRTGEVRLTSRRADDARARIQRMLAAFGGSVDSEETTHARDGSIARSTLVLRVPADRFAAAMDDLGRIGTMKSSDTRSRDVTLEVIDVTERVQTLRNSLARLHRFQQQAADVADLIRLEQEITDREAQLQSLTAQRDYLANQTAMATITVFLSTPEKYVAPAGGGFLPGLRAGWHALAATVGVALTVVGAVLPFAVVVAGVGVPAWLLVRRLRVRRTAAAGAGSGSGSGSE